MFLGTQGFLIGDATYRFEHDGDRYRISTVGQARGLAALLVRGTRQGGKPRPHHRPTACARTNSRSSAAAPDRREVAFFDWDAGKVVLHDGETAPLEAPTFDPLTILWQPYFSPPDTGDQTFSARDDAQASRATR